MPLFHAVPEPRYAIREIRLKPNPYGIELTLPHDVQTLGTCSLYPQ